MGYPSVLTAEKWGFYDVSFGGREFSFQRPYGSYVMENILFKISFPAEFHAQTAVEAAMTLRGRMEQLGKTDADIESITIRTHEACLRIIDKRGALNNPADRDHCIQYMVAIPLIFGRLTASDYENDIAFDPRIDALRGKITCVEETNFTADYHDPTKRSIANSLLLTFKGRDHIGRDRRIPDRAHAATCGWDSKARSEVCDEPCTEIFRRAAKENSCSFGQPDGTDRDARSDYVDLFIPA